MWLKNFFKQANNKQNSELNFPFWRGEKRDENPLYLQGIYKITLLFCLLMILTVHFAILKLYKYIKYSSVYMIYFSKTK